MENNNEKLCARLQQIANKPAKELTADDRDLVRECAKAFGIPLDPQTRCKDCYKDAAVACYNAIKEDTAPAEAEKPAEKSAPRYVLRAGVDVYFGKIRVNAATISDELAEQIIAKGFDRKFFVKCE